MYHLHQHAVYVLEKLRPVMDSVEASDNLRALFLIEQALEEAYREGARDAKWRESDHE